MHTMAPCTNFHATPRSMRESSSGQKSIHRSPAKPVEHQNEFGIAIGGPLIPVGSLREKLFLLRQLHWIPEFFHHPTIQSYPSVAEQQGNFLGIAPIYDPNTQAACTAFYAYQCRYRYGYTHGANQSGAQVSQRPAD